MYQVNMSNHNLPGRDETLSYCKKTGIGLVAMKPYAGGNLLKFGKKVKFPEYKTGGLRVEYRIPGSLTSVKCLHYSLSQVGVSCVVFGVKNVQELESNLKYFTSTEEERDYVYDPTGKRDPFQPFIATQIAVRPVGEEEIPITPLQKYDLSQLKLVAILVGKGEGKAMIEDAEGKGYIVEKGIYVGRNFGKVKAVLKDRVVIEERYKDYMGKVKTKEIVLQLYPPGEEEQP